MRLNDTFNSSGHGNDSHLRQANDLTFFFNVVYGLTPFYILIFIFGTAGNIATILTLRRKNLRNTSTSTYLTAFATADCFYIFLAVLSRIVQDFTIFPDELRDLNDVWCRLHMFAVYTATYISIWLLVAVSVDRAIQVVIPFRAKELSTPRNAKIIICVICLLFATFNAHQLATFKHMVRLDQKESDRKPKCSTDNDFNNNVLPWSDIIISSFLPFFLMMISSICIMIKFRYIKNVRQKAMTKNANIRRNRRESASVTTMLLATNIFFIMTVSPYLVYNILFKAKYINKEVNEEILATGKSIYDTFAFRKNYVIKSCSVLLWNLNFSIHFLLYCFSGTRFRREALALFLCREDTNVHTINGQTEFTVKTKTEQQQHHQLHELHQICSGGNDGCGGVGGGGRSSETTRLVQVNEIDKSTCCSKTND